MQHPDDSGQFVLKAKAYRSLAYGQTGVFQRFKNSERLIEVEDNARWHRIIVWWIEESHRKTSLTDQRGLRGDGRVRTDGLLPRREERDASNELDGP